jgi:membrane protease YdiL (CAAX protease family)
MTSSLVALPPSLRTDLLILIEVVFWVFVPISFVCVTTYALRQYRTGQLINGSNAPMPIKTSGVVGGFFVLCVMQFIFIQSPLYVIFVVLGIVGLLLESGRTFTEQFGLDRLRPVRALSWSLLVFGAVMLIEAPLTEAVLALFKAIHLPNQEQETVETFRQLDRPSRIFGFIFQAVFIFPVIEELFFRGFLLTFLKNYTSTWAALVLSSGLFAFAHVNLAAALPLWVLGIVLGLAYENTGSLLLPIGIHACWNLVTALSILLDKGNP